MTEDGLSTWSVQKDGEAGRDKVVMTESTDRQ